MAEIMTVRGPIAPEQLGVCYPHEHLLTRPPASVTDSDLTYDSEDAAVQELAYFRMAGGQALVEMTPADYGRNPEGLRRLSERSGITIVCVTGWIKDAYCRPYVENRTVEDLADEMIRDLTEGIGNTGICAGVIKLGTSLNKITPAEDKVIRAAAHAQRATGAPILTHTEAGTMAQEQVDFLTELGVPADRISLSHLDRRLDWDVHLGLVKSGVNLIYDQISKEKYAPDSKRIEFVARMVKEGYGDRIMLAGDMSRKSYWPSYGGGPGLTYILWRFVPWLRSEGVSNEAIHKIMVLNPARCLQWAS
jgi:phosphotriesterase-related protein